MVTTDISMAKHIAGEAGSTAMNAAALSNQNTVFLGLQYPYVTGVILVYTWIDLGIEMLQSKLGLELTRLPEPWRLISHCLRSFVMHLNRLTALFIPIATCVVMTLYDMGFIAIRRHPLSP